MQVVDPSSLEKPAARVLSVSDFCKRYRLDRVEEKRLRTLLGDFATTNELLMNAQRKSSLR